MTAAVVRRHLNGGEVTIDGRRYLVTGHSVEAEVVRGWGRHYRRLPYKGPTWWRVLTAFYPEGVTYRDGTPVEGRPS